MSENNSHNRLSFIFCLTMYIQLLKFIRFSYSYQGGTPPPQKKKKKKTPWIWTININDPWELKNCGSAEVWHA